MKAKSLIARLTAACLSVAMLLGSTASADSVTVSAEKLNLRKEADASSKALTIVREDDTLSFISEVDGWYQVKSGSKTGFVSKDYVVLDKAKVKADVEENTETYSSVRSGKTTERINMRSLPLTSSDVQKVIPNKTTVEVLGECGEWYLVKYSGRTGYVLGEYLTVSGANTEAAPSVPSAPVQPDNSAAGSVESADQNYAAARSGKTNTKVNLREKASTSSEVEKVLAKNTSVVVLGENGTWYKVNAGGRVGYVSKAYITFTEESAAPSVPVVPSAPEVEMFDNAVSGTTTESLNLRKEASTSSRVLKILEKNQSLTVLGETGTWYKVSIGSNTGYVAKAYVRLSANASDKNENDNKNDDVVPDGLVSYPAARSGAATERVNLREEATTASKVVKVLAKNASVTVMGEMNGFYQVKAGSSFGFVSKNYVILGSTGTAQPEQEPEKQPEVDKNESSNSAIENETLYSSERTGKTTVKVNMRRIPEGEVLFTLAADTSIMLIGECGNWYKVTYNRSTGYISKSYITEGMTAPVQPESTPVVKPQQPAQPEQTEGKTAYISTGTVNMRKGPGTDYGVIKVLSRGDEITTYTLNDGWYQIKAGSDIGYISSKYVTFTKPAAPAEPENNGSAEIEPVSGKVQQADWWTSNIQKTFARGVIATVTDVDTGLSWQVKRSGGTNHADVQPLTAADTAKMKQAYGGNWSWNRRAIWVTINGVSYAASMNGMPHGTGSITTNNFDGHHCIHFLNSRTHTGNRWDTAHQSMVQKAYKAGQ